MKIYKYPIEITDRQEIDIPHSGRIIHAGLDPEGVACIWAEVNPDVSTEAIPIFIIGTGHEMSRFHVTYVGSFNQGSFVWHVYTK